MRLSLPERRLLRSVLAATDRDGLPLQTYSLPFRALEAKGLIAQADVVVEGVLTPKRYKVVGWVLTPLGREAMMDALEEVA